MAIPTDKAIYLEVQIVLGHPKPNDLTTDENAFWDKLSAEIKEMKSKGMTPAVPSEWQK